MQPRIILHIDMDAFFTSVEERENPSLKGKPVVVGADPKGGNGRGVVSTANYEARKFGIHSSMPISWAYRKCPSAVFLPVNMQFYAEASQRIMAILKKYAEKFEQASIDEAFLDLSSTGSYDKAKEIVEGIKKDIEEKEKLTCSVGLTPNKLIAKIASDAQKPNGFTIITEEKVTEFLKPLNVRKLPGIGPKAEAVLKELKIDTIGQLAQASEATLRQVFGNAWGTYLHTAAQGIDEREVEQNTVIKNISRRMTFEKDTSEESELRKALETLTEEIGNDLNGYGRTQFKTITLIVRYEDFETHTKQKTLIDECDRSEVILTVAKELLKEYAKTGKKIRQLGISIGKLR